MTLANSYSLLGVASGSTCRQILDKARKLLRSCPRAAKTLRMIRPPVKGVASLSKLSCRCGCFSGQRTQKTPPTQKTPKLPLSKAQDMEGCQSLAQPAPPVCMVYQTSAPRQRRLHMDSVWRTQTSSHCRCRQHRAEGCWTQKPHDVWPRGLTQG